MQIQVYSKRQAESISIDIPHAWISITQPNEWAWIDKQGQCKGILRLEFDDIISKDSWKELGYKELENRDAVLFSEEQAKQILAFVYQVKDGIDVLAIHCHAGISRSSGVASFIAQMLGLDHSIFMNPPKFPNSLVRNTLRKVYYEKTGIIIP
jgi:predicted protein tyrosine phosphatase